MNNIIILFGFFIIVSSILIILFFSMRLIDSKTKSTDSNIKCTNWFNNMTRLDRIIESNVISTNQTFVNPLKALNSFSQLDKEEAFESCREKVFKSLREEYDLCHHYLGNLEEWISNRIEYYVKMNK